MSQVTKNYGRYNLASNEKEWCVQVLLPNGKWLSEHFTEEPSVDDSTAPSDAVEVISERLESYWISTSREEKRTVIEYARSMAAEMDKTWAENRIKRFQNEIDRLRRIVQSCDDDIKAASEEAS